MRRQQHAVIETKTRVHFAATVWNGRRMETVRRSLCGAVGFGERRAIRQAVRERVNCKLCIRAAARGGQQ